MKTPRIKVGLVGCGRISGYHLEAIKDLKEEYELLGVTDVDQSRSEAAAKKFNCQAYASLEDLLKTPGMQIASLCTPSGLHHANALSCLKFGIGCLSEKPFGVYYRDSLAVVEEFEKKNIPLYVVAQNRFNPTVLKVRHWFEQGMFGKLYLLQANVFWQRPQSYYDAEPWRGTRKLDGGVFLNQANHYFDIVQWFGGDVTSVKTQLARLGRKIECEDTGVACLRFRNGALGVISATTLAYPENCEGSFTIIAEKATIKISGTALNKLEICKVQGIDTNSIEKPDYLPTTVYGNSHKEYYLRLYQTLTGNKQSGLVTGREALKTVELTEQIYREIDDIREP